MIPVKTIRCPGCAGTDVTEIGVVYVETRWRLFRCIRCVIDFAMPREHIERRKKDNE